MTEGGGCEGDEGGGVGDAGEGAEGWGKGPGAAQLVPAAVEAGQPGLLLALFLR